MALEWKKWFLVSKRFYTLSFGLLIHVVVMLGWIPEGSEAAINESLANIVALILEFLGTIFAFRGGPALTASIDRADVTTLANPSQPGASKKN